jgi:hypothetical protein
MTKRANPVFIRINVKRLNDGSTAYNLTIYDNKNQIVLRATSRKAAERIERCITDNTMD